MYYFAGDSHKYSFIGIMVIVNAMSSPYLTINCRMVELFQKQYGSGW